MEVMVIFNYFDIFSNDKNHMIQNIVIIKKKKKKKAGRETCKKLSPARGLKTNNFFKNGLIFFCFLHQKRLSENVAK